MRGTASSDGEPGEPILRGRIVAIDVARGVALVAMTVYHFSWDLALFNYLDWSFVTSRPWVLFARAIATSFLFLVGVSLVLAHGDGIRWRGFLVRLAQVVAGAIAVSLATWWMDPRTWVFFGILHAIALFSVLALPFLRLPAPVVASVALSIWALGNYATFAPADHRALVWIGMAPTPPVSNDFVPVFPFFAATLLGVAFARAARTRGWFERMRSCRPPRPVERPLDFIGRHSLFYYLVHQPVLYGLLAAWTFASGGPDPEVRARRLMTAECLSVRDKAFCTPYVECGLPRIRDMALLEPLVRGTLTDEQLEQVRSTLTRCAAR